MERAGAPRPTPEGEPRTGAAATDIRIPLVGLMVGVWATLPHFFGPRLATLDRVEVVDHVVPGLVVLAMSGAVLVGRRFARSPTGAVLGASLAVLLAGFWMALTHLPLVVQAMRGDAPWPATAYHSSTALTVLAFGLVWARNGWAAAA